MTLPAWLASTDAPTRDGDPTLTALFLLPTGNASVTPGTRTIPDQIWIYFAPCIFLTGICGNVLILLVMCQSRMRGTSTCVYLKTMALADLVAITTGLIPDWLTAYGIITLKEHSPVLCKLEKFLVYTSADTSIWSCVVFTIDRFIAVCFPMEITQRCPAQHAKFYVAAILVAAIGKNLHVFITRGQELRTNDDGVQYIYNNCGSPNLQYANFEKFVRPWIAFTLVNILPFIIIVVCNLFIIRSMIRLRRSRRQSVIVSTRDSGTVAQMTILCLSASICFLVCVTPSMILLIGRPNWSNDDNYKIAKAVGNLIFFVNHSINFFLYCITGRKFRAELSALCSRGRSSFTLPRDSSARNSADLVIAYKLQLDRGDEQKGGKSGLYASAPCIANYIGGGGRGSSRPIDQRTFLIGSVDFKELGRLKCASEAGQVNYVGRQSNHSLFFGGKESKI